MGINFAAVIDALRSLSLEKGGKIPEGNMPLFNRMFLANVRIFGRSDDLSMIAGMLGRAFADVESPVMLKKAHPAAVEPTN
jgi:hypothetical protein